MADDSEDDNTDNTSGIPPDAPSTSDPGQDAPTSADQDNSDTQTPQPADTSDNTPAQTQDNGDQGPQQGAIPDDQDVEQKAGSELPGGQDLPKKEKDQPNWIQKIIKAATDAGSKLVNDTSNLVNNPAGQVNQPIKGIGSQIPGQDYIDQGHPNQNTLPTSETDQTPVNLPTTQGARPTRGYIQPYLQGVGGASPQELHKKMDEVNTNGDMNKHAQFLKVIGNEDDPDKKVEYMLGGRTIYDHTYNNAIVAAEQGDLPKSAKWLEEGMPYVPSGNAETFTPAGNSMVANVQQLGPDGQATQHVIPNENWTAMLKDPAMRYDGHMKGDVNQTLMKYAQPAATPQGAGAGRGQQAQGAAGPGGPNPGVSIKPAAGQTPANSMQGVEQPNAPGTPGAASSAPQYKGTAPQGNQPGAPGVPAGGGSPDQVKQAHLQQAVNQAEQAFHTGGNTPANRKNLAAAHKAMEDFTQLQYSHPTAPEQYTGPGGTTTIPTGPRMLQNPQNAPNQNPRPPGAPRPVPAGMPPVNGPALTANTPGATVGQPGQLPGGSATAAAPNPNIDAQGNVHPPEATGQPPITRGADHIARQQPTFTGQVEPQINVIRRGVKSTYDSATGNQIAGPAPQGTRGQQAAAVSRARSGGGAGAQQAGAAERGQQALNLENTRNEHKALQEYIKQHPDELVRDPVTGKPGLPPMAKPQAPATSQAQPPQQTNEDLPPLPTGHQYPNGQNKLIAPQSKQQYDQMPSGFYYVDTEGQLKRKK